MNARPEGAGGPGDTTPRPGSRRPPGLPGGQRQDLVMGEDRLHVVFGTGQVGSALAAHLAGLGCCRPDGVQAPARYAARH